MFVANFRQDYLKLNIKLVSKSATTKKYSHCVAHGTSKLRVTVLSHVQSERVNNENKNIVKLKLKSNLEDYFSLSQ